MLVTEGDDDASSVSQAIRRRDRRANRGAKISWVRTAVEGVDHKYALVSVTRVR